MYALSQIRDDRCLDALLGVLETGAPGQRKHAIKGLEEALRDSRWGSKPFKKDVKARIRAALAKHKKARKPGARTPERPVPPPPPPDDDEF